MKQLELQPTFLAGDHVRKTLDDLHKAVEVAALREYQLKVERIFRDCPGFIGASVPEKPGASGWVTVQGDRIGDALPWLKRRFHVNPAIELDVASNGIRFEIKTRTRRASGVRNTGPVFGKPEQFRLPLVVA